MTSLQVKGPRKGNPNAVSFRKTYLRSHDYNLSEFLVTIRLGQRLRDDHRSFSGKSIAEVKNHVDQYEGEMEDVPLSQRTSIGKKRASKTTSVHSASETQERADLRLVLSEYQTHEQSEPEVALWPKETNGKVLTPQSEQKDQSDSESEIEILEVRVLHTEDHDSTDNDYESDGSELSSLDEELNHVLTSTTTVPTQTDIPPNPPERKPLPLHAIIPNLYKPVKVRTSPPPPGYRNIPPNLVNTIQRELNLFFDTGGDDELEVVGKVVFSLKDPYSATKIKLPVKATTCRHFECFDLENFSLFHKLPHGIKNSLKKGLILKSHESRKLEQLFLKQQQQIANGALLFKAPGLIYPQFSEHGQMFFSDIFSRTPPLYKCPLCDEKFALKQLYISDIFNFFVKTTPLHTTRIELVESDRYKILKEETTDTREETSEFVVLSEDEDDEQDEKASAHLKQEQCSVEPANKSFSAEDFNDGLDDVLIKIGQGDGSWGNPMTLD